MKAQTSERVMRGVFWAVLLLALAVLFAMIFVSDDGTGDVSLQDVLFPIEMGLLLGGLGFFVYHQITTQSEKRERPVWFFPLMAGLLGLLCMVTAYTQLGMWPAGTRTGMIVDMHHQYAPLLSQLRDEMLSLDLGFYDFEVGLGTSFLPLFGYYLASPFNMLLMLFPEHLLCEGILFITLLKNALAAAFMAAMLQYLFKRRDFTVLIGGVMYSLSMYFLAYSWNIMWLDCLMMLPLVIIGFERLMRQGRYGMYVLTLAYTLYANYYIGFMVCIFLVLYYFFYVARQKRAAGSLGNSAMRFGIGSLLGGGLAAFLIVPVYLSLAATSAAGGELPEKLSATFPTLSMLEQLLFGATPTIRSGNLPNIYCGILAVVLAPVYLTTAAIPLRRRVAMGGLLAVVTLSAPLNIPDLIWHGLHAPNDLPYRFSFVITFVLVLMAYETITHLTAVKPRQLLFSALGVGLLALILERLNTVEAMTEAKKAGDLPFISVYVSLALVIIYAAVLMAIRRKKLVLRGGLALLLLIVTAEMTLGAGVTFQTLNQNEYFTAHNSYVDNVETDAYKLAVERTQELGKEAYPDEFFRLEFLPRRTCVDTALYHYAGITTFASSNAYEPTRMMGAMGYAINGVNSYLYREFAPATDSLLGIRYVILDSQADNMPQLVLRDTVTAERTNADGVLQSKTLYIYENTAALPIAFAADEALRDFYYSYYDPFGTINDLYMAINGNRSNTTLFECVQLFADGDGYVNGISNFQINGGGYCSFTADIEEAGQYYLYADCRAASSINVSSDYNSWSVTPYEPYIINAGYLEAGDTISFSVNCDGTATGNLYVARMDEELFLATNAALQQNGLQVTTFDDARIEGVLTAQNDGTVMTSIVYDESWVVLVDGKRVETYAIGNGFVGFDVKAGKHDVTLMFVPSNFFVGLLISGVSLVILLLLLWLRRKVEKAAKEAPVSLAALAADAALQTEAVAEEAVVEEAPADEAAPTATAEETAAADAPAEEAPAPTEE